MRDGRGAAPGGLPLPQAVAQRGAHEADAKGPPDLADSPRSLRGTAGSLSGVTPRGTSKDLIAAAPRKHKEKTTAAIRRDVAPGPGFPY